MPLLIHRTQFPDGAAGELGLWSIEEPESWFLAQLSLTPAEAEQLAGIRGRRRTEWLAVRMLVHHMSGRGVRGEFIKDEYGKPHLEGATWHISISHSHRLAAAVAAPAPVGVDIQALVPKIERLAHKYMRPEEMDSLQPVSRLPHLHVYWGAKEALFKAYGRRQIDFCRNLLVDPFPFNPEGGATTARIVKNGFTAAYYVWYEMLEEEYVLVYVREVG